MTQPNKDKAPELTDEMVYKAMEQVNEKAEPEIQKGIEQLMEAVFRKGIPPKDALGLTDDILEGMYGQAYHQFNNGRYDDASIIFRLLVILNPADARFTMGIAACHHMKHEYPQAAQMYSICGLIDVENPMPFYHASDCWIKQDNIPDAINALNLAVIRCEGKPQYQMILDRCNMAIKSLEQGLVPQEPEKAVPKKL